MTSKRIMMADRVAAEVRIGKRVLVITPNGKMEGRQWLASIGHRGARKAEFRSDLAGSVFGGWR